MSSQVLTSRPSPLRASTSLRIKTCQTLLSRKIKRCLNLLKRTQRLPHTAVASRNKIRKKELPLKSSRLVIAKAVDGVDLLHRRTKLCGSMPQRVAKATIRIRLRLPLRANTKRRFLKLLIFSGSDKQKVC